MEIHLCLEVLKLIHRDMIYYDMPRAHYWEEFLLNLKHQLKGGNQNGNKTRRD